MIEQLQEMKARLDAATPGVWKFDLDYWLQSDDPSADYIIFPGTYKEDDVQRLIINDHDADFIAHAPETQAKLIAAWEAVEAYMVEQEGRTAFPDADEIDRAYSLGRRHSYDAVRAVFREALA